MLSPATDDRLATHIAGAGPAVVLVHGFTQTGRCWGPFADDLGHDHRIVAVDAPGHGRSSRHATADLWTGADLLVAAGGPGTYVGYSMGARLALHAAVAHPLEVERLVLIGATAGIDDVDERAARRSRDAALADRLVEVGLDVFLDEWLAGPLFTGLPAWARFDEERRTNCADDLAESLRHAGTGAMDPLWDRLSSISVPVLCVAGARDQRFTTLAERIASQVGSSAEVTIVEGAGHAAHLEAPGRTADAVRHWWGSERPTITR